MPTVPQTSVIFFALLVGFVVFITLRGELQAYLAVIGLEGGSSVAAPSSTASTGRTGGISTPAGTVTVSV